MLSLDLKSGEYITIGDDIVVQVFRNGVTSRVAIKAPREMTILRGEVHERTESRPAGLQKNRPASPHRQAHNAKQMEKITQRAEARRQVAEELSGIIDRAESLAGDEKSRTELQALRAQLRALTSTP